MKILSRVLLLTLLLSYSLSTGQSKTKRKPKGGAACSQGTPYRNCPACGTTSDKHASSAPSQTDASVSLPHNHTPPS